MYCLWLNGNKVFTLQQLRASYDAEAVELYCLGGGLVRWLKDCGEQEIAERVEHIDLSQSISRQLAEIFGVEIPENSEQEYHPAAAKAPVPAANGSFSLPSSFSDTSFATSFDTLSFAFSAPYTSFFTTSFLTTSFSGGYEYEYEAGSFTANSFSLYLSSFFAETAFSTGSFSFGSGSFALGFFTSEYGSFTSEYGSFIPDSASFRLTLSSFSPKSTEAAPEADKAAPTPTPRQEQPPLTPQQKIELNISSCPLNRYGYGLHLI